MGEWFGGKTKNQAAGALFWSTQCQGWCSWVVGTIWGGVSQGLGPGPIWSSSPREVLIWGENQKLSHWSSVSGCNRAARGGEGCCGVTTPPPMLTYGWGWGVRWYGWVVVWLCLPSTPSASPLFPTHCTPLSTHFLHPFDRLGWALVVSCVLVVNERDTNLSHLAEFQTPTIFNCNFNFHCSIFYRGLKIVKIIIYILYICMNVSTILF